MTFLYVTLRVQAYIILQHSHDNNYPDNILLNMGGGKVRTIRMS